MGINSNRDARLWASMERMIGSSPVPSPLLFPHRLNDPGQRGVLAFLRPERQASLHRWFAEAKLAGLKTTDGAVDVRRGCSMYGLVLRRRRDLTECGREIQRGDAKH
jgi:hypothetical protein